MRYKGGHCGICRHPGWLSPFFFFFINFLLILHPSSFYDLRARYIYTPLYGPYSLSEALEGLVFYSLDESQDSISIGSKRTLRHELISELSNVTDDLQDYLIYFSSNFLIFPLNSPDLFKELRAGCDGFEPLSIRWGAIIARLVVARKIVEHNFWPHLFRPAIDNLAGLQRLRRRLPFASPNAPLSKSSAFASAFIPSSYADGSPRSPYCLSDSQRSPFGAQSELPQTMPSITYHTGGKEDHTSSRRLDSTPTPTSGSCPTRILSKSQISATPLESRFPQVVEDCPDEVLALPLDTIAAQRFNQSTVAHSSEKLELGHSNDDAKAAGIYEQVTRGLEATVEGEDVTIVPYAHLHSMQLTSIQSGATGELATSPRTLSPSTTSRFTPTPPCIPNSASNLHLGSTTPLPCSTPSPRSFTNSISQPLARLSPKTQHSIFSNSIHSPPTVQKRPLKAQPRRFGSSRVSTTIIPPFQQRSLRSYLTYPPFRPHQDEQRPKEPPSLTAEDLPGGISSPVHSIPLISPATPSHNTNLTPFPATPTSPPSILWGPSLAGTSPLSPTYENRATSTKSDILSHSVKDTTARLCDSVSLHDGDPKGWRSSEFEDRVAQVIRRVTGEGVTEEMLPDTSLRCSQEHRHHPHCRNLYQHQAALHSHSPTPLPPQRRCSSSSPPFHRLNGFNGRHNTQNERLRIPSRAAPMNECKGCMSSLTTNMPSLFICALSNHTSPSMSSNDLGRSFSPIGLPLHNSGRTFPQPHSRAHSQPINKIGYVKYGSSSPDDNNDTFNVSRLNPSGASIDSLSYLPMPCVSRIGNDLDSQDLMFELVMEPLDEQGALEIVKCSL